MQKNKKVLIIAAVVLILIAAALFFIEGSKSPCRSRALRPSPLP